MTKLKETASSSLYQLKMDVFQNDGDAFLRYSLAEQLNPKMVLAAVPQRPRHVLDQLGRQGDQPDAARDGRSPGDARRAKKEAVIGAPRRTESNGKPEQRDGVTMILGKLWRSIKAQINKGVNVVWSADPSRRCNTSMTWPSSPAQRRPRRARTASGLGRTRRAGR